MKIFGVYGAGGFGREVMPLLRQNVCHIPESVCVFIDDMSKGERVNGHECMTFERFLSYRADERAITVAIGHGIDRENVSKKCLNAGVPPVNIRAENSIVMDEVHIAEGSVLCSFTTITSNVLIGRYFQANNYSYVAHDCVIGDFVTFGPRVNCNGNVQIEDYAYIGTGAVLRQGKSGKPLVIGKGAIVGMGAVVSRDVLPGQTVFGNPAKPL